MQSFLRDACDTWRGIDREDQSSKRPASSKAVDLLEAIEYEEIFPDIRSTALKTDAGCASQGRYARLEPCSIFHLWNGTGRQEKPPMEGSTSVSKEKLIQILQNVLETDIDLGFLLTLKKTELETLVACIRNRVDHPPK